MAQQSEAKFVNEWLRQFHPEALQWKRVRLGPLPDVALARMYEVTLRWVDAIYIEDDTVHLVEAKMEGQLGGLSQLILYGKLFRETPEFKAYWDMPIALELVAAFREREVEAQAASFGIRYIVWAPPWYTRR